MKLPDVIVLNGTGSSGKTSLAHQLQEMLPYQYLNFSIDAVLYALPPSDLQKMMAGEPITRAGYHYPLLVNAYHRCLPPLLQAGCRLILDNAWLDDGEKREVLTLLAPHGVFLVGVACDLPVAQARELARGDRAVGLAAKEFPLVHRHMTYDFVVDTTHISPREAAVQVQAEIGRWRPNAGLQATLATLASVLASGC